MSALLPCLLLGWLAASPALAQDGPEPEPAVAPAVEPEPAAEPAPAAEPEPAPEPAVDPDRALADRLGGVFAAVPDFSGVTVEVTSGVVRLGGEVPSARAHEEVVALAKGTPGVVYVDDELREPTQVSRRVSPALQQLRERLADFLARLPLYGLALLIVLAFWGIARALPAVPFLSKRLENRPLLQGLARQVVRTAVVLVGVLLALQLLDLTALVGAVLGAAGVFGVAVGFAFKDIAENYLASILLSTRQPFSKDDLVRIGDLEGKVVRLTLRETVLMTLDGNHLRVPNAQVFKGTILNYTLNPLRRFTFNVGVGVNEDLEKAARVCREAVLSTPGVVDQPAPAVFVEALADSSVTLSIAGWVDQRSTRDAVIGYYTARSEAIRRVKVALDAEGLDVPEPIQRVFVGPLVDGLPPPTAKKPAKVAKDAPPLETAEPELQVQAQVDADRERGDEDLLR